MNRTQIITICVLILIAAFAIGWVLQDDENAEVTPTPTATPVASSPTPTPTPKSVHHTVHYTTSGPSPKSLTVRVGDTVAFYNDTPYQYWPLSTGCAGFDARRGLNQGEAYTLRFSTPGTCTYVNNLLSSTDPLFWGTIIVQ